jgi:hypothetical protein
MTPHPQLDARLARLILTGADFTADDLTDSGAVTIDPDHRPNARQNGIGSYFTAAAKRGLIEWTGRSTKSTAPHRKGGLNRIWQGTDAGRLWAHTILAAPAP